MKYDFRREGIKESELYHPKIFDILNDLKEEDYINRVINRLQIDEKRGAKLDGETKEILREELRQMLSDIKAQTMTPDDHLGSSM